MKPALLLALVIVAGAGAAGGYWYGTRHATTHEAAAPAAGKGADGRRILYYRNPMGLPDTSPVPKKDPMGMDYIAVYEGEEKDAGGAPGEVKISTARVQKLGVKVEPATLRTLDRTVRAVGRVEPDERRTYAISPKFEGYVERLHVNVTGQAVARGAPLFEAYSPELVSAQREYAIAIQGLETLKGADSAARGGMQQLAESALARLRNWDVGEDQVRALAASGEARRTLTFRSPVAGIVTEKKAVQGMRFMAGEALYQVTDLTSVWVIADVFEQDIGLLRTGAAAQVRINAYPDRTFTGRVTYVYPTLKAETRTIPVRVELSNPGLALKPGMFADVNVSVGAGTRVLAVPASAVIDSGVRRIVIVQREEGRFEPRPVETGAWGPDHVEIRKGVQEGEKVVVAANFLIDAESNLKAAIGGFTAPDGKAPGKGGAHQATGTVDSVEPKDGAATISHDPVASLNWPSMTMEFKAANGALLQTLKPGARIRFEFVERAPGEWVITQVTPQAASGKPAPKANPHSGH